MPFLCAFAKLGLWPALCRLVSAAEESSPFQRENTGVVMENPDLKPSTRVLSRSPLHTYITGPSPEAPKKKNPFNPYRRKPGILSFLGLEEVDEILREADELPKSTGEVKLSDISEF